MDKTEHGIEEHGKAKVKSKSKSKSTQTKSTVKVKAENKEMLNGPTRTHLMGRGKFPDLQPWWMYPLSLIVYLSEPHFCKKNNGFTNNQIEGVDVDDIFSPVVKPDTIRTVLSLATFRHWSVHQLDIKNAFLHVNLSETVYMHQLLGFRDSAHPDYACLLQRSLYGLKQAPRAWFQRFAVYITCITVTHNSSGIFLSQRKYAAEILERAHMANCNPSRTPVDTESKLRDDGDPVFDPNFIRVLQVTNISKIDKNRAKKDKTEHEIRKAWENEAKDIFHL
ncbi:ribonuclease H-like domain-containing protein [Tanacetum coccineum]